MKMARKIQKIIKSKTNDVIVEESLDHKAILETQIFQRVSTTVPVIPPSLSWLPLLQTVLMF